MFHLIGIGNSTRRDDGVAWELIRLLSLPTLPGVKVSRAQQLDTTLLEELSDGDVLLVADADPTATHAGIRPAGAVPASSSTHSLSPGLIPVMARELYGRNVETWVCGLPAEDFGFGEGLSATAHKGLGEALPLIREFLSKGTERHPVPGVVP